MKPNSVILASASPRRVELLRQIIDGFAIRPSAATEVMQDCWSPRELCQLNAHRKARTVARQFPNSLVLGADTLVFLDCEVLGKPASLIEAHQMLARLQGRSHQVITGVSLIHRSAARKKVFAVNTAVRFRSLTADQIQNYLSQIHPLDKAGAYAIQEHGHLIIEGISGSYSNVVGLPMERLRTELTQWL